jgi:hypothetical protein
VLHRERDKASMRSLRVTTPTIIPRPSVHTNGAATSSGRRVAARRATSPRDAEGATNNGGDQCATPLGASDPLLSPAPDPAPEPPPRPMAPHRFIGRRPSGGEVHLSCRVWAAGRSYGQEEEVLAQPSEEYSCALNYY